MKKNKIIIAIILIFLESCGLLKNIVKPPIAKLIDVKIMSMSFDKVNLNVYLEVENPNGIDMELTSLKYNLNIKDKNILNGLKEDVIKIKSNTKEIILIPITINTQELLKSFGDSYRESQLDYTIYVSPVIKVPILGDINIPLSFSGKIPLPKIPIISVKDIDITKKSFTEIEMIISLSIKGNGGMNLYIENINYFLNVNGIKLLETKFDEKIFVSGTSEQIIKIPLRIKILELKSYFTEILKGNYKIDGNYSIGSDEYNFLKSNNQKFSDIK